MGWGSIAVLERVAPFDPEWNRADDEARTDLAYFGLLLLPTAGVSRLSASLVGGPLGRALRRGAGRPAWPAGWPLPARVGLALLVSELGHYAHHRVAHHVRPLWRAPRGAP